MNDRRLGPKLALGHACSNALLVSDVFPVNAPADQEHAAMLESRINFIREEIIEE